jgi:hypothetical protein
MIGAVQRFRENDSDRLDSRRKWTPFVVTLFGAGATVGQDFGEVEGFAMG